MSTTSVRAADLPPLRADRHLIVDATNGQPVILKGCNLGNWLMVETWMLGWSDVVEDQHEINTVLAERFGADEAVRLMELYRVGYVTPRDVELVKSFGFNVVRVPFDYRLMQADKPPYALKPDAFRWLDRALEMCEAAGLYAILDMHGTPGGQSKEHHTGHGGQNKLWGNATNIRRTADLWRAIATRYRDRPSVAAYDLINEPYGDYRQDLRKDLVEIADLLYRTIRAVDDRHLILVPGALHHGIGFYGDPTDRGWTNNVGFTEHFYPGLFGDSTALSSHARMFNVRLPQRRAWLERVSAPYLVGECNVVLEASGGDRMMRRYFDAYGANGWAATLWSYKLLNPEGGAKPDNWYMVTNAEPLPKLNVRTAPLAEIETFFTSLATMPLAVDENLRATLTAGAVEPIVLGTGPDLPTTAPADKAPSGWSAINVGNAEPPGGVRADAADAFTLVAGGADIWADRDSLFYLSKLAPPGDFEATTVVHALKESHQYAKAGLMARSGLAADAAHALINVFPDGSAGFCYRPRPGADTNEHKSAAGEFPVALRLGRRGDVLVGYVSRGGQPWTKLGETTLPKGGALRLGLAATAHDDELLTEARFTDLRTVSGAAAKSDPPVPPAPATAPAPEGRALTAWNRWGEPLRIDPGGAVTYDHAGAARGNAGVWQDTPATVGQRYMLATRLRATGPAAQAIDSVEVTLEATLDGRQVTVAIASIPGRQLVAAGNGGAQVSVTGTAPGERLRALIRFHARDDAPRAGVAELRSASLHRALD